MHHHTPPLSNQRSIADLRQKAVPMSMESTTEKKQNKVRLSGSPTVTACLGTVQ